MLFRTGNKSAGSKQKTAKQETPFEARRRELSEQEAQLKAAAARHESFIQKAPKIAEEIQKKQRENFLHNAARIDRGGSHRGVALPDSRYLQGDAAVTPRARRRDRQQGKWLFFILIAALLFAMFWAWQTLFQPAF
jgi:small-conductance mechanosensitive channel